MERRHWAKEELILALSVYFQLPFGRLNRTTPEVKELAKLINRSANSVALRLVNFAACDPVIIESGRTGMKGGLSTCLPIWNEYSDQKDKLFFEAERIKAAKHNNTVETELNITEQELQGVDRLAYVKQRVNQRAFRSMILNIYERRCAITGINIPDLLVASHIIPWSENHKERLNPENGMCLSALYDKAFDKGFISFNNHYQVIIADKLKVFHTEPFYEKHFKAIEGTEIYLPEYHRPNKEFLEWHRDMIFNK